MQQHRQLAPLRRFCRVLAVSRSGYYAWARANAALVVTIRELHQQSREAYGAVKTWHALRARGLRCGKHRVARLRRLYGIEARRRRRFKIATRSGWLYLAVLLDLYSRKVVGWAMLPSNDKQLGGDALEMALVRRRPGPGLIHHTDRGSTYAAETLPVFRAEGVQAAVWIPPFVYRVFLLCIEMYI